MSVRGVAAGPQELAERALQLSSADGCIVIVDEITSANLRWANNNLTTNGLSRSRELTVIAVINTGNGPTAGVVARQGVTLDSLEDVVRAAEAAARSNTPAEDAQELAALHAESPGWSDPPAETSFDVFADFAPALGNAFESSRRSNQLLFGYAEHNMHTVYLASSTGLRLRHDQPFGHVEINAKPADFSASAWVGAPTNDFRDVDASDLAEQLTRRLAWSRRTVDLPAGRYETLLPPTAVADLMFYLYYVASARAAQDGRTVFSKPGGTRVGEKLSETALTLRSDPTAAEVACEPFLIARASTEASSVFDNGLPLSETRWIDRGTLSALVQTRHSAEVTRLPFTPRIGNLILEGPGQGEPLEALVAKTKRGLLLTTLFYIREVDPRTLLLTGLTRDGVYLIEDGEVVAGVNNFRFNESPVDLLARVAELGAPERALGREFGGWFAGRTRMPALRIPDFNMSTVSQAS